MEFVLLWIACAIFTPFVAMSKNRCGISWLLLGLVFGFLALIAVGLMPKVEPEIKDARPERKCPYCAEMIKAEAVVCRFCGKDVDPISDPAQFKLEKE